MNTRKASFGLMTIIVCFAAVLWMAAACGDDANSLVEEEIETATSEPLDIEETPEADLSTREETTTATSEPIDRKNTFETNPSAKEECMTTENTKERIAEVADKYEDFLSRKPNVYGVHRGNLKDENGEETKERGIIVRVSSTAVDQSALPPEDRVPDCLDGVPVQVEKIKWQWMNAHLVIKGSDTEEINGSD